MNRKKIAVIFGGISPEHDVSILTGVQACHSLDQDKYEAIPVYVDIKGVWWAGESLLKNHASLVNGCQFKGVKRVDLSRGGLYCNNQLYCAVDICLIALHGGDGEDGTIQGICEANQMPYTGMRRTGATVAMNKWVTKKMLSSIGVKVLPDHLLHKLPSGQFYSKDMLTELNIKFPVCVKPCSLGSSVGVGFADDLDTLQALLLDLFDYDDAVLIEPAVQSLKEFNVAVRKDESGEVVLSAIESPKTNDWLDFQQKYCQGSGHKKQSAHGLINLSRDINPSMPTSMLDELVFSAKVAFEALGGFGMPRIDFIADMSQKKIWLNEVNTTPGSFGHYLWAAKNQNNGYVWVLNHLLEEANRCFSNLSLGDPVPKTARLFKRNPA